MKSCLLYIALHRNQDDFWVLLLVASGRSMGETWRAYTLSNSYISIPVTYRVLTVEGGDDKLMGHTTPPLSGFFSRLDSQSSLFREINQLPGQRDSQQIKKLMNFEYK